jgi:hypothetical protein
VHPDDVLFGDLADPVGEVHVATSKQSKASITRTLPDKNICRASTLTERFAECLVEKPAACPYAMPFGYGFLCGHPDRDSIIADTAALRQDNRPL